jgi:Rieske Fe-S protein
MERRTFLRWATHGLGAVFAAVLGFPAIVYLIDARNRPARERGLRPTGVRVSELTVNIPKEAVIRETTRDAWTLNPDDIVGRVWLVRRDGRDAQRRPKVDAFSTICPHMGCSVNHNAADNQFLCPCHGGCFHLADGRRVSPTTNPAPRDMDRLATDLRRIDGTPADNPDYEILVAYKKFKPNQPKQEEM